MPAAMEVNQEPDCGQRSAREHGSLLVLALLAFAVGGTSGLLGAVFRLVLERSDRFRGAVIDWAHGKEIAGFALVIGGNSRQGQREAASRTSRRCCMKSNRHRP